MGKGFEDFVKINSNKKLKQPPEQPVYIKGNFPEKPVQTSFEPPQTSTYMSNWRPWGTLPPSDEEIAELKKTHDMPYQKAMADYNRAYKMEEARVEKQNSAILKQWQHDYHKFHGKEPGDVLKPAAFHKWQEGIAKLEAQNKQRAEQKKAEPLTSWAQVITKRSSDSEGKKSDAPLNNSQKPSSKPQNNKKNKEASRCCPPSGRKGPKNTPLR